MDKEQILPVLDTDVLREKATEYAMKGAIDSIKEYYSGYNSPYKKAIEEELKKKELRSSIDLPDILALINDSLSKEIDLIANTAIAKTFIPLVQQFLTRESKEMKFSEILKEFIESTEAKEYDDCSIELKPSVHGWIDLYLSTEKKTYRLTLHGDYSSKEKGTEKGKYSKYQFLSLPSNDGEHGKTMKISLDNVTLEMPFTSGVLSDKFTSFIARLVIGNTLITMDCNDFSEDMFPQDEECHC